MNRRGFFGGLCGAVGALCGMRLPESKSVVLSSQNPNWKIDDEGYVCMVVEVSPKDGWRQYELVRLECTFPALWEQG